MVRRFAAVCLLIPLLAVRAGATEIDVVSSGGFAEAYKALAAQYEAKSGDKLVAAWGPSMGTTTDAVPQRLARHEQIDLVIMVGYALQKLVDQGVVAPGDQVALANSGIGLVVKQGAPKPDIGTVEALKQVLLNAKSIAYSDSASGVYIQNEMFKKMGIEEQMKGKARMIPAEPVGAVVARGEAEVGFQQISELKPIKGIELVGPIPAGVQQVTVFSGGVLADAPHKEAARALLHYLASPEAAPAVRASGLEPITAGKVQ